MVDFPTALRRLNITTAPFRQVLRPLQQQFLTEPSLALSAIATSLGAKPRQPQFGHTHFRHRQISHSQYVSPRGWLNKLQHPQLRHTRCLLPLRSKPSESSRIRQAMLPCRLHGSFRRQRLCMRSCGLIKISLKLPSNIGTLIRPFQPYKTRNSAGSFSRSIIRKRCTETRLL